MTDFNKKNAGSDLKEDLVKVKDALVESGLHAKDQIGEALSKSIDDLTERTDSIQKTLEKYVKTRPFAAAGIALLTGLILGRII